MEPCVSWLSRMNHSRLSGIARELGVKVKSSNPSRGPSRRDYCRAITRVFGERCAAARGLSSAELLSILNDNIFYRKGVKIPAGTPKEKLCIAVAATLNKEGECSREGLNWYQCAAYNSLNPEDEGMIASIAKFPFRLPGRALRGVRRGVGYLLGGEEEGRSHLGSALTGRVGAALLPGDVEAEGAEELRRTPSPRGAAATMRSMIPPTSRRFEDRTPWEKNTARRKTNMKPRAFRKEYIDRFRRKCQLLGTKNGLVRVFSQNCHLRPPTIMGLAYLGQDPMCGDVNFDDVQMKRACQIVTSIQRMRGTTSEADIICLQEVFKADRQNRIIRGLKRFYPHVTRSIADAGSLTLSKYPTLYNEFVPFTKTIGADTRMKKGMLITFHEISPKRYLLVFNIHPSAYVDALAATTPDVYRTHVAQLRQIRAKSEEVLRELRERFGGRIILVFGGDFNINRYASYPDSEEEHDPSKADLCCSNEFMQAEHILNAVQPPIAMDPTKQNWYTGTSNVAKYTQDRLDKSIPEPVPGHGGVYSWDGSENTVAVNPLWPVPSYQMIDFIMVSNMGLTPAYMDNRIVRLPTLDIVPWIRRPMTRKYCKGKTNVEQQREQRIKNMRKGIRWRRSADGKPDLKRYGSRDCGVNPRSLTVREFKKWRQEQEQGFFDLDFEKTNDYLPYQMYNNVSDHYGVLAYIVFPNTEAAAYSSGMVPLSVYSIDAMKTRDMAGQAVSRNMRMSNERTNDMLAGF